ncbi:MAG: hypothetical protein NC517_09330 [Firmicutes bacterium]|nr:hypothetical protein [Bacillota bacterium]
MKKIISCILITVMLVPQLCGCGTERKASPEAVDTEDVQDVSGTGETDGTDEPVRPESVLDLSAISKLAGKDNSLDAYSWVNGPQQIEIAAAAPGGGIKGQFFLGNTRAYYYNKSFLAKQELNWDELAFSTLEGGKNAIRLEGEDLLWGAGPVCGTDHYAALECVLQESQEGEEDIYRFFLTEKDENNETVREVPLDFLNGSSQYDLYWDCSLAVDGEGVIHLAQKEEEEWRYLFISAEGEILAEYSGNVQLFRGFVPLYDGSIAWRTVEDMADLATILQRTDRESGRTVTLAAPKKEVYCYTLFDDNTLVYADGEGVYRSDLSGNEIEPLYLWRNHGILLTGVPVIQADEAGNISLVYEDAKDAYYLRLEPVTEEVEIHQVTIALSQGADLEFYQTAAAMFNRKYPTCHIELKSDYDKTALLTELIAGKGPVLIDGFLVGFEEQEKLWEPLDAVMEQMGILDELETSTLELGKINGTLYGVVMDFELDTVVTGDTDLKDWNYDTFLQGVDDRPELEAIFNLYGGDYGTYFIMNFLSHGIEDSYFLDAEAGTTNFDSDEFRRVLEMAKKYCVRNDRVDPGRSMLAGRVFCNELSVSKPEHITLYRICYGPDVNYIGYPTKDGAAHYIRNDFPLAVRRTASKEDKEIACAFIQMCLSYECQSRARWDINFLLSVRRDVLEEQIAAMNKNTSVAKEGFGQVVIGDSLNRELDGETLHDLIDKAKPKRYFPIELRNILSEELELYFADAITEDMLIEHLESRVGLYLAERN